MLEQIVNFARLTLPSFHFGLVRLEHLCYNNHVRPLEYFHYRSTLLLYFPFSQTPTP